MDSRFDRNVRFFGKEGQARLQEKHVTIVGGGGVGEHAIQQLAFLGPSAITVVDDEELTRSNLNRYVLARHDDPIPGTTKVNIAERAIRTINPAIEVVKVKTPLRSREAFDALHAADVVFGCVDNDGARLVLVEYCLAYGKDYFDLATDIKIEDGLRYGGRMVFMGKSGDGCLVCLGELDMHQARQDLEDEAARRDRERIYGVDKSLLDEGGPSVVSLNGVVASLGVTEFMVHATGIRSPKKFLVYRGHQGIVTNNKDEPTPGCYYCGIVKGSGAKANVERYLQGKDIASKSEPSPVLHI